MTLFIRPDSFGHGLSYCRPSCQYDWTCRITQELPYSTVDHPVLSSPPPDVCAARRSFRIWRLGGDLALTIVRAARDGHLTAVLHYDIVVRQHVLARRRRHLRFNGILCTPTSRVGRKNVHIAWEGYTIFRHCLSRRGSSGNLRGRYNVTLIPKNSGWKSVDPLSQACIWY